MLLQLRLVLYSISEVTIARVTVVSQISTIRSPNGINSIHSGHSSSSSCSDLALFQRLETVKRGAVRFEFLVSRGDDNATAIVDRVDRAAVTAILDRYRNSRTSIARGAAGGRSRCWTQPCFAH